MEAREANPKLFEIKFNSVNKWQLSIHRIADDEFDCPLLLLKGAPERVLKMCDKIMFKVTTFLIKYRKFS